MLTRKGNINYINVLALMVLAWSAITLSAGLAYAEEVVAKTAQAAPQVNPLWIYLTIVILFIIFGGSVAFMFVIQRKYLNACIQDNQLAIFAQSPAGMPEGTVRAMISFIIITVSLYLTVLLFFNVVGESKFPEALSSLLGAVVGFYFGSRTGSKDDGTGLQAQVKDLKTERDTTESNKLLVNIKKGIDMTKAVVNILPDDQKKKYTDIITKLEQGYDTVNSLTSGGSIKDALAKGQELFDIFKKDNPARDIFSKALASFSTVLGGSVPALAIITTVVGVGVKLVGTEYEKWKKRVLNVPITPAVLHLRPIDANTGFTLLLQCPIFKTAFAQELEGNDRPFMTKIMELINQPNVDDFWNTYKNRFDTREKFDQGLQELRRATLDSELAADTIDRPELFAQAGGVKEFMKSVDRINTNEEAQASLQQLVLVVEQLQKEGEPVPTIFEKVQKEMGV
jgi:predicted RNase H-like HicB family nuclease